MHIQHQNREHLQQIPVGQQLILFLGFVTFITGLICFGYAFLAWFLLPFSSRILLIACIGLIAAYLGRKALRRGRQEITL
ncbi:MAG: hypothetical protein ACJAYN_001643 [Bermanella sp.]|jgi:membrane protein implicated in regulation of membrane protease activity|uniref:NfeD family protein n=1 Tax=Glaciecola sp. 33A TaxID=2057807 RepID=UPI000C34D6BE|nr:hypothetical protein [Glaciecola sp. 33A]PKI03308.1 hypothetical protein CXF81_00735 [Glaciecola sp. 33A]